MELCDLDLEAYIYGGLAPGKVSQVLSFQHFAKTDTSHSSESTIWDIMRQIANGVQFMHNKQMIHRDLKPRNGMWISVALLTLVLYSSKDSAWKLADFGFTCEGTSSQFQISGLVRGTSGYRAPELLAEPATYTNKVDIWAMGCILHELAVARKAFINDQAVLDYRTSNMKTENCPF